MTLIQYLKLNFNFYTSLIITVFSSDRSLNNFIIVVGPKILRISHAYNNIGVKELISLIEWKQLLAQQRAFKTANTQI